MIKLHNVSKTYANSQVKAVDELCLEVKPGEVFGFLGPNGAGKSTTIKMLTGILMPDCGSIEIAGVDLLSQPILAKGKMGYVPDNHTTYENLKAIEFFRLMGVIYNVPNDLLNERIEKYTKLFSIDDVLGNVISGYSHGMKQKVMLVAALLHDPDLWILDEPLTGLDPQSAYNLKELMKEHTAKGKSVFFSSHVIDVVEKVCDRIAIINKGKLVIVDTLDNIRANSNVSLEDIFLSVTANTESAQ